MGHTCTKVYQYNSVMVNRRIVIYVNPFPHMDAFWHLCSRRICENKSTKEEIAQYEQFLLLLPCIQLYSTIVLSFKGSFHLVSSMLSMSSDADVLYVGRVNPLLHTRNMLQIYLKIISAMLWKHLYTLRPNNRKQKLEILWVKEKFPFKSISFATMF